MAWTSPKTYTVGELLTAADMNLYQRDNLEAGFPYGTTWQTYTPALTASTTNPTLGSGATQSGRYYRVGQLVAVHFRIMFGTSGAAGSGVYSVSLPINMTSSLDAFTVGVAKAVDSGASNYPLSVTEDTASKVRFESDGTGTAVGAASPFAWGTSGDTLTGTVTYEGA